MKFALFLAAISLQIALGADITIKSIDHFRWITSPALVRTMQFTRMDELIMALSTGDFARAETLVRAQPALLDTELQDGMRLRELLFVRHAKFNKPEHQANIARALAWLASRGVDITAPHETDEAEISFALLISAMEISTEQKIKTLNLMRKFGLNLQGEFVKFKIENRAPLFAMSALLYLDKFDTKSAQEIYLYFAKNMANPRGALHTLAASKPGKFQPYFDTLISYYKSENFEPNELEYFGKFLISQNDTKNAKKFAKFIAQNPAVKSNLAAHAAKTDRPQMAQIFGGTK